MKVGCGPTSRGAFSRTEDEACLPAGRDGAQAFGVDPVTLIAHERLTRNLEEDALVRGFASL